MSTKYDLDNIIPELLANLEVHEILLSGLYANWIAGHSSAEFGLRLMDELSQAAGKLRGRPTGDPDEIAFLVARQAKITAALQRFAAKTLKHGADLRARNVAANNDDVGGDS